jgi:acetoin utilization deacetylase AcuC-like enzyme
MSRSDRSVIFTDRFRDHRPPPGHPERPERADVMSVAADRALGLDFQRLEPTPATLAELEAVHTREYLEMLRATAGTATALDPDTYTSPESYDVALLAAGAALRGIEWVMAGRGRRALVLVRPPGHHAESARAMGFCLFNNVAAAAARARALGAQRVAIVDYDVHHGNGTQEIFYHDARVLYVSTHQYPYYPGTGSVDEVGEAAGQGFTFNVPLSAGATDGDYALVFETLIEPVLARFNPDVVLVSAGFDAHERDPLGGMRVTTPGYARLTSILCEVADRLSNGRICLVTEGGYDLQAFGQCLMSTADVLNGTPPEPKPPRADATSRSAAAISAVRTAQRAYWPGL